MAELFEEGVSTLGEYRDQFWGVSQYRIGHTQKKQMKPDMSRNDSKNGSLSKQEIFHLLQNSRRRQVLQFLLETNGTVQISEMAEQIAAWEQVSPLKIFSLSIANASILRSINLICRNSPHPVLSPTTKARVLLKKHPRSIRLLGTSIEMRLRLNRTTPHEGGCGITLASPSLAYY